MYLSHANSRIKSPLKALKGFKRIYLKAGESKWVEFVLKPADLSVVDDKGVLRQHAGKIIISVGGGQPGLTNYTSSNVISHSITVQ
jgi:beta-glucosidase